MSLTRGERETVAVISAISHTIDNENKSNSESQLQRGRQRAPRVRVCQLTTSSGSPLPVSNTRTGIAQRVDAAPRLPHCGRNKGDLSS